MFKFGFSTQGLIVRMHIKINCIMFNISKNNESLYEVWDIDGWFDCNIKLIKILVIRFIQIHSQQ